MIYDSLNAAVFARIPARATRILDIGCGAGALGGALKERHPCEVVGVTYSNDEAESARQRLDRVEVADLNGFAPRQLGLFDCIVCSHVLEHLLQPERLLRELAECLLPGGVIVVALPNVLFWKQRLQFLRGRFRYTDGGLMDRTHFRFFDWMTASALITDAGLVVSDGIADGGFPLSSRLGAKASAAVDRSALRRFPGLFGFQFVFVAGNAGSH